MDDFEVNKTLVRNLALFSLDVVAALKHEFHLGPLWYPAAQEEVRTILRSVQKDPPIPKGFMVDPVDFDKYPQDEVAHFLMTRLPCEWTELFRLWTRDIDPKPPLDPCWSSDSLGYSSGIWGWVAPGSSSHSPLLKEVGRRLKEDNLQQEQDYRDVGVGIDICDGLYDLSPWDDHALTQFVPAYADDEEGHPVHLFGPDCAGKYDVGRVLLSTIRTYWCFVESWNEVMSGASPDELAKVDSAIRIVPRSLPRLSAQDVTSFCAREVAAFSDLSATLERALARAGQGPDPAGS